MRQYPISPIYTEIWSRRPLEKGLDGVIKRLGGKVIKVAALCSGTESPLLAMQMLCDIDGKLKDKKVVAVVSQENTKDSVGHNKI